jgi:hypothetical protein
MSAGTSGHARHTRIAGRPIHRLGLDHRSAWERVQVPHRAAASPRALAHEPVVTEIGPHPTITVDLNGAARYRRRPRRPATSVPFTAVLNGPERTTTDNREAASTCVVPHPRR